MVTYEEMLCQCSRENPNVVVMTAENRAAIRGLPEKLGARFWDVGICEQTLIGAAAGLALRGRVPVVHALACFLTMRGFEFIRTDVGIPNLPVKLVGGVPGFLSEANGPTHQALEDIGLMRGIPGMNIVCPADGEELVAALPQVIAAPGPWYIRYNDRPASVVHPMPFVLGKAERFGTGQDVILLVSGMLLEQVLQVQRMLVARDIACTVVNVRTVKPIDRDLILACAGRARLLVTVEDHFVTGGLFSIVSELLAQTSLRVPVFPVALPDRWFQPALLHDVLAHEGFTGPALAARVEGAYRDVVRTRRGCWDTPRYEPVETSVS